MKELEKHRIAFEAYYRLRNMSRVARELHVSRQSLSKWRRDFNWADRCAARDQEVNQHISDTTISSWADMKIQLVDAFFDQFNAAVKAGIVPENSRDLVAISRELRALLGEGDKVEVEFAGIEYHLVTEKS